MLTIDRIDYRLTCSPEMSKPSLQLAWPIVALRPSSWVASKGNASCKLYRLRDRNISLVRSVWEQFLLLEAVGYERNCSTHRVHVSRRGSLPDRGSWARSRCCLSCRSLRELQVITIQAKNVACFRKRQKTLAEVAFRQRSDASECTLACLAWCQLTVTDRRRYLTRFFLLLLVRWFIRAFVRSFVQQPSSHRFRFELLPHLYPVPASLSPLPIHSLHSPTK